MTVFCSEPGIRCLVAGYARQMGMTNEYMIVHVCFHFRLAIA